jgi:hypothetical protein
VPDGVVWHTGTAGWAAVPDGVVWHTGTAGWAAVPDGVIWHPGRHRQKSISRIAFTFDCSS